MDKKMSRCNYLASVNRIILILSCAVLYGSKVNIVLAAPSNPRVGRYCSPRRHSNTYAEHKSIVQLTSSLSTITPSSTSVATVDSTSSPKTSPISQLATFIKDNVVRIKNGTGQLYTNHKRCNTIRSKKQQFIVQEPKTSQNSYQKTGITFEEYNFLIKGKEDRGKVINLMFMGIFSPNFLPYAFTFLPNFLPSTLQQKTPVGFNKWETISRERTHTVLKTLLNIEKEARSTPAGSLLNLFGMGGTKHKTRMKMVDHMAGKFLALGSSHKPKSQNAAKVNVVDRCDTGITEFAKISTNENLILDALQNELFSDEQSSKKRSGLSFIPKVIMSSLAQAIDGNIITSKGTSMANQSPISSLTPNFIKRNKVITHIKVIKDADSFLLNEGIDLNSLSGDLLLDTCHARMIGNPKSSERDLRKALFKWLNVLSASAKKNENASLPVMNVNYSENDKVVSTKAMESVSHNIDEAKNQQTGVSTSALQNISSNTEKCYNANLATFALMCYNAVDGARNDGSASTLPRFLLDKD